jgi:hypothetical protein
MYRKITPFLITSIAALVYAIFIIIDETDLGWGWFAVFALLTIGLLLFIIDFGLKKWLRNYRKIIIAQASIIIISIIIYSLQFQTKTLIIPSNFNQEYVTIVYGFEDSEDLSISVFTLSKKIIIPKNGVLITSSDFDEDLPKTKIKTDSGIELNSDESDKGFIRFIESEIEQDGKIYKFRTWKIQEGFCCSYSIKEKEIYKNDLAIKLEEITASR